MSDNIALIGQDNQSVKNVISGLNEEQDTIKNITVIIEYKKGDIEVCHNQRNIDGICFDYVYLGRYVSEMTII